MTHFLLTQHAFFGMQFSDQRLIATGDASNVSLPLLPPCIFVGSVRVLGSMFAALKSARSAVLQGGIDLPGWTRVLQRSYVRSAQVRSRCPAHRVHPSSLAKCRSGFVVASVLAKRAVVVVRTEPEVVQGTHATQTLAPH